MVPQTWRASFPVFYSLHFERLNTMREREDSFHILKRESSHFEAMCKNQFKDRQRDTVKNGHFQACLEREWPMTVKILRWCTRWSKNLTIYFFHCKSTVNILCCFQFGVREIKQIHQHLTAITRRVLRTKDVLLLSLCLL